MASTSGDAARIGVAAANSEAAGGSLPERGSSSSSNSGRGSCHQLRNFFGCAHGSINVVTTKKDLKTGARVVLERAPFCRMTAHKRLEDSSAAPPSPRSVEQITREAEAIEHTSLVPLRFLVNSARQLRHQADIYEHEGNHQEALAYLLYYRHAVLVLKHLPKHPDARTSAKNRELVKNARDDANASLERLERLKPVVQREYDDYQSRKRAEEQARKEARKQQTKQAGYDADNVRQVSKNVQRVRGAFLRQHDDLDDEALVRQMQHLRMQMEGRQQPPAAFSSTTSSTTSNTFHSSRIAKYPTVRPGIYATTSPEFEASREPIPSASASLPPELPKKELVAPPLPTKAPFNPGSSDASGALHHAIARAEFPNIPPPLERDTIRSPPPVPIPPAGTLVVSQGDPAARIIPYSAFLENGSPLRALFLNPSIRGEFEALALPKTRANLETCGILCGRLQANALYITHLIIPPQTSTSDMCEMTDAGEIALFDAVDNLGLLTLGWIHTHPTQTCFMSSRDLHTHCGYQAMMPEAVAVVCAPSQRPPENSWGVFRLTDPPGMGVIRECTKPGLFHPHDVDRVYTDAMKPGHVVEDAGLEYEVLDLR